MTPRIIFMGTPAFAVPYLEGLIHAGKKPIVVITQEDKPTGRKQIATPSPVKQYAIAYEIPVLQPHDIRSGEWIEQIRALTPDLVVVVAFGQIIPQSILDIPPKGCINVHPSLLPRHRGASPLQETILQGDPTGGVTIMLMDAKMDHGPILAQTPCPLDADETYESLRKKITDIGVPLLLQTIDTWLANRVTPLPQDHTHATTTRTLTRESGRVDWTRTAEEIERQVRAFTPWPGTWTKRNDKRLKILQLKILPPYAIEIPDASIGDMIPIATHQKNTLDRIIVPCGKGLLELLALQPEGRSPMSTKDFINGGYLKHFQTQEMNRRF